MREKLESLDAVRALACLFVVTFHAYLSLLGHFGVSIFFVLSGFLSAYNHTEQMTQQRITPAFCARFTLRKTARLYPLHLIMLLFPAAVQMYGIVHGLLPVGRYLGRLLPHVLLLQAWIPLNEIYFNFNIPSWFLSAMVFLQFMLPYLLRRIGRCSPAASLAAIPVIWLAQLLTAAAAVGIYSRLTGPDAGALSAFRQWFTQVLPLFRLGDYAIGCHLAQLFLAGHGRGLKRGAATGLELAALALAAAAQYAYERLQLPGWLNSTALFLPPSALLVYAFALGRGEVSRLLTNRLTGAIAGLSADIYLIHYPFILAAGIVCTRLPLPQSLQKLAFVCAVFIPTLALSALCSRIRAARKNARKLPL